MYNFVEANIFIYINYNYSFVNLFFNLYKSFRNCGKYLKWFNANVQIFFVLSYIDNADYKDDQYKAQAT